MLPELTLEFLTASGVSSMYREWDILESRSGLSLKAVLVVVVKWRSSPAVRVAALNIDQWGGRGDIYEGVSRAQGR